MRAIETHSGDNTAATQRENTAGGCKLRVERNTLPPCDICKLIIAGLFSKIWSDTVRLNKRILAKSSARRQSLLVLSLIMTGTTVLTGCGPKAKSLPMDRASLAKRKAIEHQAVGEAKRQG